MHEGTPHAAHRPPQAPKPSARLSGADALAEAAPDPIDQLTELFLGGLSSRSPGSFDIDDLPLPPFKADSSKATIPKRASAPRLDNPATAVAAKVPSPVRLAPLTLQTEVVVIGHLPVAASAWVHHYASYRQRQVGTPVALLRWRGDTASLDLFGTSIDPLRPESWTDSQPHSVALGTMEEAVRAAARVADTLIVSVEETREIEATQVLGVKRVAVLTGSHDTAIVACYRALKGLVQHDPIRDAQVELAVVVLGGPDERSRAAAERLQRTTLSHLSHEVHCEVVTEKISTTRSVSMYVGQISGSPTAFLRNLLAPKPASSPNLHEPAPSHSQAVTSALTPRFPGLRSVEARCPFAPAVEVAVSSEGILHVLASAAQPSDVSKAVADLTACASWVEVNAAVLRSAIPELAKRVGNVQTNEHLVTTEPKLVRGLLDSRLRLHLDAAGTLIDLN